MQSGAVRVHAPSFFAWPLRGALTVLLLGLAVTGCTPDGKLTASMASRTTVAFDSIDGPPPGIFQKLVQNLNDEAQTRGVAVVSRDDPSQYRVRGYLAAHVAGDRTSIAWVWDVYDADQRRTLRLHGEESGARTKDAWSSADEQVLQRIARDGMDQLVAFLNTMPAPTPDTAAPTLASGFRGDSPESAGIFPLSHAGLPPEGALAFAQQPQKVFGTKI